MAIEALIERRDIVDSPGRTDFIFPTLRFASQFQTQYLQNFSCSLGKKFHTLNSFTEEIIEKCKYSDRDSSWEFLKLPVIPQAIWEYYIQELITRSRLSAIFPSDAHELSQFFKEILNEHGPVNIRDQIFSIIEEDIFHSIEHGRRELEKFEQIFDLFQTVLNLPVTHGSDSQQARQARFLQNFVKRQYSEESWKEIFGLREIWVVGLTTLSRESANFLAANAKYCRINFFLDYPPHNVFSDEPIRSLINTIKANNGQSYPEARRKNLNKPIATPQIPAYLYECSDPEMEVELAIKVCQDYLKADSKYKHNIAIIVPSEAIYAEIIFRKSQQLVALDPNFAIVNTLQYSCFGPLMRWLLNILKPELRENQKEAESADFIGFCRAVGCFPEEGLPEHGNAAVAWQNFNQIKNLVADWDGSHPVSLTQFLNLRKAMTEMVFCLKNALVNQTAMASAEGSKLSGNDAVHSGLDSGVSYSRQNIEMIADQLASAIDDGIWIEKFNQAEGYIDFTIIHQWINSFSLQEIRDIGEPLFGIQVLSLPETRGMEFDAAIMLGCAEKIFPSAMPDDRLVDDFIKYKAGLGGWKALEAKENTTFELIRRNVRNLHITFPLIVAGEQAMPGRYIEMIKSEGQAVIKSAAETSSLIELTQKSDLLQQMKKQTRRAKDAPDGRLASTHTLEGSLYLSPSAVSNLLLCPFKFALYMAKFRKNEDFENKDLAKFGQHLHLFFELFFDRQGPIPFAIDDINQLRHCDKIMDWCIKRRESVEKVWVDISKKRLGQMEGSALKNWHFREIWVDKYLQFFANFVGSRLDQGSRLEQIYTEKRFNFDEPQLSSKSWHPWQGFHGVIDKTIVFNDCVLVLDFKTGQTPAIVDCENGLAPQLPIYMRFWEEYLGNLGKASNSHENIAGITMNSQSRPILGGYWSIMNGSGKIFLESQPMGRKAIRGDLLGSRKILSLQECYEKALMRIGFRIEQCREQGYFAIPNSCRFCDYQDICRHREYQNETRFRQRRDL